MDANQRWDVGEAIDIMKQLAQFKPIWIEEPTSPDDVLGSSAYGLKCILQVETCYDILLYLPQDMQQYLRL